ncbi:MAG: metal ABC transporter substrate-binding protein, partial [Candidatus Bathyarchaeia archaeon]
GILAEIKTMKGQWKKQKLIQPHGVFDYFIEDLGLEIVGTMQPHGREPSAKEMKDLIELIRKEDVGAILLEPQYPEKVGRRLSEETGIPVILLEPVNSGPDSAPLDYYDKKMRENLKKLMT